MPAAATLTLTAFRASALERGEAPPERLRVHPWGAHEVGKRGKSILSEKTVSGFAANMAALKLTGRVALDFRHNTVPGMPAYKADKEPRLSAAYGLPEIIPGDGLYLTALEWTPEGKSAFLGGHFQDISPAVFRDADGNVMAIHSAALCDHGEIDGLTIEAATAPAELAPHFAALTASLSLDPTSPPMKPTPELIALLALLSITLAADADEAATTKAITDATAKVKAAKEDDEEGKGKPEITALTARLDAIEKGDEQRRRDRLMEQAKAEGKIIPLSTEQWNLTALSTCEALVAGAKAGEVPMNAKTTGNGAGGGVTLTAFSAEHEDVFSKMGITPDEAKKHLPQKPA